MMAAETKQNIKKEITIAWAGTIMLVLVFVFQSEIMQHSSPLVLLLIVIAGLLLSLKFKLPGGTFIFFGGLALAVHPLLFSSSYWLLPGGALTGLAGFLILINWWRQNNN